MSGPVVALQDGLTGHFNAPDDTVAVIINYREPSALDLAADMPARRAAYAKLADDMLSKHAEGLTLSRRYAHVPAIAARITKAALDRLMQDPNVSYIQLDGRGGGGLKEAVPAIGGDLVKSMYNLTGKGVRVAILDTGVVTQHPDLKDSIVAQHCFTQGDCPPLRSNEGTSAEDDHGHGSNVAGIITSNGVVSSPGFAPGADIVVVKIDDQNDSGQISDWVSGLDWVFDNLAMLKVNVINMSICTTDLYTDATQCDSQQPALAKAVKNLVDAGVTIFSAAGNLGSTTTLSAPACNTGVIAVGAVYDSNVGMQPQGSPTYQQKYGSAGFANCGDATTAFDQVTCFSNTPTRVDIVAPGAPMTSDGLNNLTSTYWGTSQASPVGAGVAALMLECNPSLKPADIKAAMIKTGVMRTDPKDGHMFPSLRALDVVKSVCFANAGSGGAGGSAGAAGTAGAAGAPIAGMMGTAAAGASGTIAPGFAGAGALGASGTLGGTAGTTGAAGATVTGVGTGSAGTAAISGGTNGSLPNAGGSATATVGHGAGSSSGCGCSIPGGQPQHDRRAQWCGAGLALFWFGLRWRALASRRTKHRTRSSRAEQTGM